MSITIRDVRRKFNETDEKLTPEEFIVAMKTGWRGRGYAEGIFFKSKSGYMLHTNAALYTTEGIANCCALGAACCALNAEPWKELVPRLSFPSDHVAAASNRAGSKRKAIEAVEKLLKEKA